MKLILQRSLVLCAVLFPLAGTAQVYKCQDADGAVRFTDRPCDSSGKLLSFPASDAASDPDAVRMEKTRKLLRAMRQERDNDRERDQREQDERRKRRQNCNTARDRLAYLESAGNLYRLNEAGERVVLSDAQRTATIEQERRNIGRYCDSN